MQNQQHAVPNPPQAITTKDILYIKDAMSWELLAFKKFHHLAQHVTDPEIKQALENAGSMHQKHYQTLLSHLSVDNNQALSQFHQQQHLQ
jgi:rubrerythrin